MIEIGKIYEVHDKTGRFWGSVCLKYPFSSPFMEGKSISGYLKASADFYTVYPLFIAHEKFMSEEGMVDDIDDNSKEIAELGVVLHDPESGENQAAGPVFVSDKLLFTCDLNEEEI
jgi:hypothetical protein